MILLHLQQKSYQVAAPQPKKLFTQESSVCHTPPKDFLQDLQRVMNKKWQVAEKCRVETDTSPHQVLGFRDNDLTPLVGTGEDYSRDDTVGAWVLHSQQYAKQKVAMLNNQQLQQEPLYAVCLNNQQLQQE